MPLIATVPHNQSFVTSQGSYRKYLNLMNRKETAVQRIVAKDGLGGYETLFSASLMALCELRADRIAFFDVGSHIGLYSTLIGTIFHHSGPFVLAFEPTPRTFELCCALRDTNDLAYMVMQKAVAADSGSVAFYLSPKSEASNSLNADFRPGATRIDVEQTTLDQVVAHGAPAPNIIKIDVETMEADVVFGARNMIAAHRPIITCELLKSCDRSSIRQMIYFLTALDYRFYRIEEQTPFPEFAMDAVLDAVHPVYRDWIFAPKPLGEAFYASNTRWRSAMKSAGPNSNLFVEAGNWQTHDYASQFYNGGQDKRH
jgi:FkbM family methyltransferase